MLFQSMNASSSLVGGIHSFWIGLKGDSGDYKVVGRMVDRLVSEEV